MISIRDTYKSLVHCGSVFGKLVNIFSLQSTYASRQSHSFGQSIIGSGYVTTSTDTVDTNNSEKHATANMAESNFGVGEQYKYNNIIARDTVCLRDRYSLHGERAETTISERRKRTR